MTMTRRQILQLASLAVTTSLGADALWLEHRRIELTHTELKIPGLARIFDGFTLIQLSDLHVGAWTSASFLPALVRRVNALQPDLIVLTGDLLQSGRGAGRADLVWPHLQDLGAREGVCAVLGNHDHWADESASLAWLDRSGFGVRHRCHLITRGRRRLAIGGAGDLWVDSLGVEQAFARTDEADCRILLSHNPDSADSGFATPVDLIVSGHTHGGQVCLPWVGAPLLPVENKRYQSGLVQTGVAPMYISRGLGWAIAPLRFNCRPEIARLELRKA
jgi:uncharacterized protein